MKIKKTPSKKLAPVPRPLSNVIESLEHDPEDQISVNAAKLKDWPYPRGDLFHWVPVLNRFDSILQRVVDEYDLKQVQSRPFDAATKDVLVAITEVSKTLFEYCTNRNIYNSYEHMNALVNTTDIDVLVNVLRFMLRPAQRVNNPRAVRSTFATPQDRIIQLAHRWSTHADYVDICRDSFEINEDMTTARLRFYRTQDDKHDDDNDQQQQQQQPSASSNNGGGDRTEGMHVIVEQLGSSSNTDSQDLQELVKQHDIPKEYHFELANQIRIAKHIANPVSRRKLLLIRILAIAIMAHTLSETTAQTKVFLYEPHLITNLADLVRPDKEMPFDIQTYALCALDGIARNLGKLSEVLTALNVSANHGILLQILRRINNESQNVYPREFLDALFTLLSCVLQNQPGGQMLMSAGVIPMLVQILGNQQCIQTKYVSKIVSLLDAIVNAFSTSFSAFVNAGGLDTLLGRIKNEVEYCLQFDRADDSMDTSDSQPEIQPAPGTLAPYDRISAIKSMLKFLLRMMEAVGTADALRNLIETSVPRSLLEIISHPKVFGANVLTIAINIMTTFIHSEPTSLSILQEAKLPQAFLETICAYSTPNSEVLLAAINGFGAICLNPSGLEMFNKANPLPHFFDLLTDHEFLRNTTEVDSSTALGNTMDELIRHHPSLKPTVFECLSRMIKKVIEMGSDEVGKPNNDSHRLKVMPKPGEQQDVDMTPAKSEESGGDATTTPTEEPKKDEKTESLLVSFIDMVARFLEGLFQNQSNIREFVKEGGPEVLLEYYTLPYLPAEFSVTIASDSLAYILKVISDVSTLPTIMAIAEKVKQSIAFITENNTLGTECMVKPYIDVKEDETAKIEQGNSLFRRLVVLHGYVGLLSNICCSTALVSSSRNALSLVTEFTSEEGDNNILLLLGQLYRTMMWENFLLKESIPSSWYSFKSAKKHSISGSNHPLGIFGVSADDPTSPAAAAAASSEEPSSSSSSKEVTAATDDSKDKAEKTPDASDPRIQNVKHFKLLLGDIPQFLMPMFQGLVKVSISRNASQAQKTQAYKLSELMTRLLKENITWLRASMDNVPACKYDYLQTMYTMVSLLLLDDRPHASLHTPLALTFDRRGGTELLLEDLEVIWNQVSKVHSVAKEQRTKEQQELLPRMYGSLEMLLTVLVYISSPKLVHDSPSTAPIVQRDRKSPDYFDPYEWIIGMQLKLSTVKKYFQSPDLDQFSRTVLHVLLDIVLEILKGEGESSLKHESFTPSASHSAAAAAAFASSPFAALRTPPPPVVADPRGVQTLVDMGFDRAAAEQAMVRCNNQISRAVDYLFSHPQPVLANAGRSRNTDEDGEDDNDEPMHDSSVHDDDSDHDSEHEEEEEDQPATEATEQQQQPQQQQDMDQGESSSNNNNNNNGGNSRQEEEESQKQKEAELVKNVETLQEIRVNMKKDIPPLVLDLVDKREDLLFDIRGLLVAFCNNDDTNNKVAAEIMTLLISRIKEVGEKSPDSPVLGTRLRLLALFYKESAMQPVIPRIPSELSFLFDMVNSIGSNADTPLPPWFTTVFLVLEAVISQAEEPRKEKLVKPSNDNDDSMSDVEEEQQQKDDEEVDDQPQQTVIDVGQRTRLLNNCVTFLQKSKLTRNEIYAILRVVVHLTKDYDAACKFVEYGGLPLLFAKPRASLDGIQGQQAFVLLILRHIIESPALLQSTMEELLTTWFTVPRPRQMEAKAFIRTNAHLALRDPNAFLKAVENVGSLTHYDKHMQSYNVKLRSEDDSNENDQSADNKATSSSSDADVNMEAAAAVVPEQQQPSHAKASSSTTSAVVVNHLLNELLSIRATSEEHQSTKPTDEEKKAENQRYAYIAFLLQCLVELVQSYKSCKYDIYAFGRRRGSKDGSTTTSNKTRSSILHMLLNDLLPYNAINPNTEESRKQQGVSMWAASLLVAMCYETPAPKKTDNGGDDLAQVRKYVFDGIIRSLKETVASSSGTLAAKYGKFLALSDLCHRLLNARPNTLSSQRGAGAGGGPLGSSGGSGSDEESIMSVAKIMVDKNFVGSLTAAISDVDINYPHAKTVLNSMLRPLEQLTKLATKIPDDAAGSKEDGDKKRGEILSYDVSASTDTEAEDTPDLYRNSALGMFDGSVMEEDEMDEFESEEEDEETFDEEEFDDDSNSDLSDMSEVDDGDEDVDDEMGAMIHQFDTDMEEDEDGSGDEDGDGHDTDHTDGSSDYDEDGREMTWRIEDIEDDPDMHVDAEIEVDREDVFDSADEHDGGHHANDVFGEDGHVDELETLDQSDFDEDEDSENIEDAEAEADIIDDRALLDDIQDENPFLGNPLMGDGLLLDDDRRHRSMGSLHFRRFERPHNRGRLVVEPTPSRSFRAPSALGGRGTDAQDDMVVNHPLLTESQQAGGHEVPPSRSISELQQRSRSTGYSNWQAFEDIVGGSAMRFLESFLSQAPSNVQSGPFRIDLQGRGGGITRTFEFDHLPHTHGYHHRPASGGGAATQQAESQGTDQMRDLLTILHDFQPLGSADRWHQEARMMYGSNLMPDKAQRLTNAMLNLLFPITIREQKIQREKEEKRRKEQERIEAEERKKQEEERKRREEEERKKKEEEERRAAEEEAARNEQQQQQQATGDDDTAMEGTQSSSEQAQGSDSQQPTTITIHGEEVDISGTGIDIEFLEALPEDLREEVVNQHMREHRPETQASEPDAISPEFLDALPPDIREEVLHQEALERDRRERQQRQGGGGEADGTATTAATTATTTTGPEAGRQQPSAGLQQLDNMLTQLFSNSAGLGREANTLQRFLTGIGGRAGASTRDGQQQQHQRKHAVHRNAVQLVDRAQLSALARLLFVPQTISKSVLNKLLINLCENNKTRSDLLSFLVCVLHDGGGDLAAVDRSFAQLSLQAKGIYKPVSKPKGIAAPDESVPNFITQRCLEFLMQVVRANDQSLTYFLVENDCLAGLKRTGSRKGKGKEKMTPSSKYPLLVLMSLLDRNTFIDNPSLMEELMHLITTICRPFPALVKKYVDKMETRQQKEGGSEDSKSASANKESTTTAEESKATSKNGSGQKETTTTSSSSSTDRPTPKPPTIPDHYLKQVVHVLTSGECSSKTFQYTLSALSHLSSLDGAQQTITLELVQDAQDSGKHILKDLGELLHILDNAMAGAEIQGSALGPFSAASSHQAKLLRVLKTIDYLYSPKTANTGAPKPNENNEDEQAKNEKRVLEIYSELKFLPLWKMLGRCLAVIHEKDDLINVATVLLPLIEAFMVVSKYSTEKTAEKTTEKNNAEIQTPTENEKDEDFFFAFTEEHKKVLNIMVRNNPSLMIGSFSLLVRNPKMLEFDNKRNYFVQQLHKRHGERRMYAPLQLNVRRQYVFEDSYHQLLGRTGDEIKYGKLSVRFYDEEGVDAGGVAREWFSVLSRQMFDPNYALFITSAADKLTYQPNRASAINPDHLSYLKFVGRVIGKAIYDGRLMDAYFTRSFYKHILNRSVDYRDVEAIDPEYYKSLVWMLENDITDVIDLTFSIETDDFGTTKEIDLKPGGRDIPVTEENKHEYVALVTEQKLTLAIKDQINAFLQGFHDIIPPSLIQIFNEQELELLISGLPDIDIDDWKANTEYQGGYSQGSPQIQWFWRAVRSFDQEERAKLLQFATGTSKVPLEGFSQLQGSGGIQRFQIHKDYGGDSRLPSAHTCFNQIDLPEYDAYETLRSSLFKAINECSTGFGFI